MPLLVVAVLVASHASAGPRVSAPSAPVPAGAGATVTLHADGPAILVDGCSAVELEHKPEDRWIAVEPTTLCDGSAPARSVAKELSFTVAPPGPGEYRVVVAWGAGCVEGRPFALSACKTTGVARSAAFRVESPPPPPR